MGQETPDNGTFDVGETVKIAYVDQTHHDLLPEKTVYEVISQGTEAFRMGGRDVNARAYLSKFNFTGADQEKKIGVLSGRRTQPIASCHGVEGGRQRAVARRAYQRHRCQHASCP